MPRVASHGPILYTAGMSNPLRVLFVALIPILLLVALPSPVQAACVTPRQAMSTFLDNLQPDQDRPLAATECFDWSGGPTSPQDRARRARELKAVLDGRGLFVDYSSLSDDSEHIDAETGSARLEPIAALPDLVLEQQEGRWVFARSTVQAIPALLQSTYRLPLHRFAQRLPPVFHADVFGVATWKLLGLAMLFMLAWLVARGLEFVTSKMLGRVVGRFLESWSDVFANQIVRRASWIVVAALVAMLLPSLGLPVRFNQVLYVALRLLASIAAVLIATSIVDLLADGLQTRADATETRMDDQLIPLVRRSAKLLVVVIGTLFVLQNLSVDVTSVLGSLAIGGLAFSLAAKDTLANLFGSVTIFTDRPFQIGDWVVIGEVEGTVEEVGFRSTRIRTFYDSVATLPNNTVANATIDNMGRRRYRRFKIFLGLTYDTTAEQMEAFVGGVRAAILENPHTRKDSFEVHFNGMGAHSLDVLVYCFFAVDGWAQELQGRQQLMLSWMRVARETGVEFAFPTQTLHLEGLGPEPAPPA